MILCSSKNNYYQSFDEYPVYKGNDLGLTYTPEKSVFKVWAPTADEVELRIYEQGTGGEAIRIEKMQRQDNGTWGIRIDENICQKFYTYRVKILDKWRSEVPDIYAYAVGVNGHRAAIVNLQETNPEGWDDDTKPPLESFSDIVLYEIHVRDFSSDIHSGIENKRKFKAFTEKGTLSAHGLKTGLDHLIELGVTHVHLLPVFDFLTVDEENPETMYNWGYDPLNYNVPEGSYATSPHKPDVRIREFKELVLALHRAGIRVIMDVVYNHTGDTLTSSFNQLVPGYYYRQEASGTFSNGSGCGNETASERDMVRKFILDSLKFWTKEYHIDGFRFDLMGIHDTKTMNLIRAELNEIDPTLFVYGEPWLADRSPLPEKDRAVKDNLSDMPAIAVFNDDFRDAIKGSWANAEDSGFIGHRPYLEETIKSGIVGGIHHQDIDFKKVHHSYRALGLQPWQSINFFSCHDNHTLWDRIQLSCHWTSEIDKIKMYKLACAIVLTSQGIPFLHGGTELMISKNGEHNSYKSPDAINQLKWDNKARYNDVFQYIQNLIQIRRHHPAFHLSEAGEIIRHLSFINSAPNGAVAYKISHVESDNWKNIVVVFNANHRNVRIPIPYGKWVVVVTHEKISAQGLTVIETGLLSVPPISTMILVDEASIVQKNKQSMR
jgi:pullulanase